MTAVKATPHGLAVTCLAFPACLMGKVYAPTPDQLREKLAKHVADRHPGWAVEFTAAGEPVFQRGDRVGGSAR